MTHSCNHCKTEFRQRRRNQFYCTQSCRQLAYVERKYSTNPVDLKSTDQLSGLADMLGNMNPEMLVQILNAAVNNPSMTDKAESAVKPHDTAYNPSQNVNSSGANSAQKSGQTSEDLYEKYLKTLQVDNKTPQGEKNSSVLSQMIKDGFTIPIGTNEYVRSLFPHWENKDWFLSVQVNEIMLGVFDRLKKASREQVISYKTLMGCYGRMKEIAVGAYAHCLPQDYPFISFIRFLMYRLESLAEKAKGLKEIKFSVPRDLEEMMAVIRLQIE